MTKKEKAECDLPDELRCRRSDNKNWRCVKPRAEGCSYCEHHRDILHANYQKRKTKKEGLQELVIGITKNCVSNKYKIREPEIAETIGLPREILALENLRDVLNKETWIEHLTPTERSKLCALLPNLEEDQDIASAVESLLSGENFNFGNPMMKWGASVWKGDQRPDALILRERELKLSQSQYFKDLKAYHHTLIDTLEELKQLCESCHGEDAKFREELEKWKAKESRESKSVDSMDTDTDTDTDTETDTELENWKAKESRESKSVDSMDTETETETDTE